MKQTDRWAKIFVKKLIDKPEFSQKELVKLGLKAVMKADKGFTTNSGLISLYKDLSGRGGQMNKMNAKEFIKAFKGSTVGNQMFMYAIHKNLVSMKSLGFQDAKGIRVSADLVRNISFQKEAKGVILNIIKKGPKGETQEVKMDMGKWGPRPGIKHWTDPRQHELMLAGVKEKTKMILKDKKAQKSLAASASLSFNVTYKALKSGAVASGIGKVWLPTGSPMIQRLRSGQETPGVKGTKGVKVEDTEKKEKKAEGEEGEEGPGGRKKNPEDYKDILCEGISTVIAGGEPDDLAFPAALLAFEQENIFEECDIPFSDTVTFCQKLEDLSNRVLSARAPIYWDQIESVRSAMAGPSQGIGTAN